ncbi:MAG TPA: cyclopropane-fatty-acyl-phospholipid synthase family protein, partial [Rhizomicrobium sp.]
RDFVRSMAARPVAEFTQAANDQHYELPPAFFALCLGPHRKYSSCLYPIGSETLAEAEFCALEETVAHADLKDGQTILELGCGWGSLSLFMAEHYPNAKITAVSNSAPQRGYIEAQAAQRGLKNLQIITADMNDFSSDMRHDRIVSVEMFEHMANWPQLFNNARNWLEQDGRMFLHVFAHNHACYRYETADKSDWIAQHFFTGGLMPSRNLVRECAGDFAVESEWRWSGMEYKRTALQWLENFDANRAAIDAILADVYGAPNVAQWRRRWRMFFLATAEMFGYANGKVWGVSHYRLRPF